MAAGVYNFPENTSGDSNTTKKFKYINVDGNPVDLTNVAIKMTIKSKMNALVAELEKGSGITVDSGETNAFVVEIPKVTKYGTHDYNIEFTFPGDVVRTWLRGEIPLLKDVAG